MLTKPNMFKGVFTHLEETTVHGWGQKVLLSQKKVSMAQVNLKCDRTQLMGRKRPSDQKNLLSLLRWWLSFSNANWLSLVNAHLLGTCPFHIDC